MAHNENLLEETVFPSEEKTILPRHLDDNYGGAHAYNIKLCLGFNDGQTIYSDTGSFLRDWTGINFVRKLDNGQIISGL